MIIAVLEMPASHGEPIESLFRRRETDLRAVFSQLHVDDALRLHARISSPGEGDVVASQFQAKMGADRRGRLMAFLADVRRRPLLTGEK